MARKSRPNKTTDELLVDFHQLLANFTELLERQEDVRKRVQAFVPVAHTLRDVGVSLVTSDERLAARDRVLIYLRHYHNEVIHGDELAVVAGISEWARRVRELRVEFGWSIASGVTLRQMAEVEPASIADIEASIGMNPATLLPEQYILLSADQDRDAALRWNMLNVIRKEKISVKDKLIKFLRQNTGRPVTGEELRYLAKDATEWARRTRELRTEEGWAVATRNTGRPDLPVGVYVLEHDRRAEPHDRKIPDDIRVEVLKRDGFACQDCDWTREQKSNGDPRNFLELHHKVHHAKGGANTATNLTTLCNVCHDKLHRQARLDGS
jgi:uncharacterized protein YdcH (DUF465 family)